MQMNSSSPIYYDSRWFGDHGIGRYAREVIARLSGATALNIAGRKLSPVDPLAISLALAGRRRGCYFSPGFNPPLASPIPVAFTIHDLIHLKVAQESSLLRAAYYALVVRPAARRAFRVFTVSAYSRGEIAAWTGLPEQNIVVTGNAPAPAFIPTGARHSRERDYFLHVGRRGGHKNIGRLLTAFAASRAGPQTILLFTGVADAATLTLVRQHRLDARVAFTGPLTDDELAACYRGAIALVFPSLHEGFGLPIVEAMACGTPVITAAATATRETAGEGNALLVSPLDTEAITDAIDKIHAESGLRARLIAAGLRRAADFSWDRVGQRVREQLEALP